MNLWRYVMYTFLKINVQTFLILPSASEQSCKNAFERENIVLNIESLTEYLVSVFQGWGKAVLPGILLTKYSCVKAFWKQISYSQNWTVRGNVLT